MIDDNVIRISNKNSLIWINVNLDGQQIPAMVDSGANPNCISLRCVQGSPHLKKLTQVHQKASQKIIFVS